MKKVTFKKFSVKENETWKTLFNRQSKKRDAQIVPMFSEGLKKLGITEESIPNLDDVNSRLYKLTKWEGIPVEGLEEGKNFYSLLAERKFPIGNFIRDEKDLSYTPAPDIFHDLYGHIPFYADKAYAEFCEEYGKHACRYKDTPSTLKEFERFFWFTMEFGLLKTKQGRKIFGAGITSSYGECEYALSDKPEIINFDIETIRNQNFRIDVFQEKLFLIKSLDQLYNSLEAFVSAYK